MENDDLASSGRATPDPESVRPGEEIKPSRRILEIISAIAADRLKQQFADPTADFMMKITGSTAEGMLETLKHDSKIQTAAIILYLDELVPLLVGRDTPPEATAPTEAKP